MLKTSYRISLYVTIFVATLTALFFVILNTFFFASWYREEPKPFQDDVGIVQLVPEKQFIRQGPGRKNEPRWQERAIILPNITTGRQDEERYFGIYNVRKIDDRWREIMTAPRGYVLIDVTQNVNRQNWLGLYSIIMWVSIVVLSFVLSGSLVRISLKDLISLSKSVKKTDISNLNEQHYFANLPDDDEINTIAKAINSMKLTISHQVNSLKEFLAFASHELKTPLMIIQSSAESAQYTKDYKASLNNIKTGVDRMQHIVKQLSAFVKVDGNVFTQRESINITKITQELIKQLEIIYKQKNITATIKSPEDLIISSYPNLVQAILSNLLDNAFKYANENGEIIVTINKQELSISNTGETISETNLARIREPFRQQDKTEGHGSGLGLAIVHKAIERLYRDIQVSSQDNLTTFSIHFDPHAKN